MKNEELLKNFVEQCGNDSKFITAAEAIEELSIPKVKEYRPYSMFDGRLCKMIPSHENILALGSSMHNNANYIRSRKPPNQP